MHFCNRTIRYGRLIITSWLFLVRPRPQSIASNGSSRPETSHVLDTVHQRRDTHVVAIPRVNLSHGTSIIDSPKLDEGRISQVPTDHHAGTNEDGAYNLYSVLFKRELIFG